MQNEHACASSFPLGVPEPSPPLRPLPDAAPPPAPPVGPPGYSMPAPPYRWAPALASPFASPPTARPAPRRFAKPLRPIELVAGLGIVVAADVALWSHASHASHVRSGGLAPGGFGIALLFLTVPLVLYGAVARTSYRRSRRLAAIVGMLALVVLRSAIDPTAGTFASGVLLLGAFALALRKRRVFVPEAVRSVLGAFVRVRSRVAGAATSLAMLVGRRRLGRAAVLPIVVPAGLLLAFLGVFALANPVVAHALASVWNGGTSILALPSIGHLFFWAATILGALALLRPACPTTRSDAPAGSSAAADGATTAGASPTALLVARNALVLQNVLFLGYNALDARYLWTGSPPAGMPTQDYAHAGAFWLTVALVMLTAVIGVMFRGPLARDARAKHTRTLAYVWMAQGLVLACGTYRRIAIHIAKSGLSDLRIVGILGTSLVVCGVVLVLLKLRQGRSFTWLVRRQLDALALTAVIYSVAPTHLVSARVNVARVNHGEYRPILHTFHQSRLTESAAALLPLLDHPDPRVRQGVAALLEKERERLRGEVDGRGTWRERDLASQLTLRTLDAAGGRIEAEVGAASLDDATRVLLEISHAANEDRSLEELLAIPAADGTRTRGEGGAMYER